MRIKRKNRIYLIHFKTKEEDSNLEERKRERKN